MPAVLSALIILLIDQLSKIIVLQNLGYGQSLPVVGPVFYITLVCNKGIGFSIFSGCSAGMPWLSLVLLGLMIFVLAWKSNIFWQKGPLRVYFSLILAGGASNLIDRIRLGCVVDFLDFRIWPVFNIADSAITVGAILLTLHLFKQKALHP